MVSETPIKDFDVFFVNKEDWLNFNESMRNLYKERNFITDENKLKRVNLRKFELWNHSLIDSIWYLHVQKKEHIVETFDFTINMLWIDFEYGMELKGSNNYSITELINHIVDKKLIIGKNLWYKANVQRAVRRYKKFRYEGYSIDEINRVKYSDYIKDLAEKTIKLKKVGN